MKKKAIIFFSVLFAAVLVGYRIQKLREEGIRNVNNTVRIHKEKGAPMEYVVAKKTTDFLEEPLFVQNGRALVSTGRIGKFSAGQEIKGVNARIVSVSKNIDLDTGMFMIRVSGNISGNVMVLMKYSGYFLPVDAVLPDGAKIIAKDNDRMVVVGLNDGDKVIVR
jgi:hypothetical protein